MCMWIVVLTQAMHFSLFVLLYSTRAQQYSFKTHIASLVTFKVAATQERVQVHFIHRHLSPVERLSCG